MATINDVEIGGIDQCVMIRGADVDKQYYCFCMEDLDNRRYLMQENIKVSLKKTGYTES